MTRLIRRAPMDTHPMRSMLDWFGTDPFLQNIEWKPSGSGTNMPIDVSETDDHAIIRASLPGFNRDQINLEIHDDVLTIEATRTEETEDDNERFHHREISTESVSRRIQLPCSVADEEIDAELNDGVLTLRVPKAPNQRPRRIKIK